MTETPNTNTTLRLASLPADETYEFLIVPDADQRKPIAAQLELLDLRKLRFAGKIRPEGRRDWRLEGTVGATVVQPCVITLAPVVTRIDEEISRLYVTKLPEFEAGSEDEMPEDDSLEPIPEILNLTTVLAEALALALPLYPRADGAAIEQADFAEPGVAPMTDEDAKPFAALAKLKNQLKND